MKEPIRKLDGRRPRAQLRAPRQVVAALILRGENETRELFICQRRPDQPMSLKWEFPGGKVEPNEAPEAALARELNEELGIDAIIGAPITRIHHNYRNGSAIQIQFFLVTDFAGELQNRIFNDMRWSPLPQLPEYDFLAADLELVRDLAAGKLL